MNVSPRAEFWIPAGRLAGWLSPAMWRHRGGTGLTGSGSPVSLPLTSGGWPDNQGWPSGRVGVFILRRLSRDILLCSAEVEIGSRGRKREWVEGRLARGSGSGASQEISTPSCRLNGSERSLGPPRMSVAEPLQRGRCPTRCLKSAICVRLVRNLLLEGSALPLRRAWSAKTSSGPIRPPRGWTARVQMAVLSGRWLSVGPIRSAQGRGGRGGFESRT